MIISHQYKFIFLKTNKTAGTSIEIALSKFCGPEDVITPITPEDEKTRLELGYRGPQNYLAPVWDYRIRDIGRLLIRHRRKNRFFNHITAQEVKANVPPAVWNGYFKFCVERNPWDRVVSHYYWVHTGEPRPTVMEFLGSPAVLKLKARGLDLYTIDGQMAVDKICRFENLAQELESVRIRLGIPEPLELPRAKSRFRKDKQSYRDLLGEKEKAKISDLFSDEIRCFGYEF